MLNTRPGPMNQSSTYLPAERYTSVPGTSAAHDGMLDLALLRITLARKQRLDQAGLRHVQLMIYALAATGWIAFFGHLAWIAVTTPGH